MPKTLALLHTTTVVVPVFADLCRELLPGLHTFHIVDESLLRNTMDAGRLEPVTVRRAAGYIQSAREAGADAVLVTCSSIGPVVDVARRLFDFPVLRVDEPMAEQAVRTGRRIGVLATISTTLDPTAQLLRETALRLGETRDIEAVLCRGAYEAVASGDAAAHDRIVAAHLTALAARVDVVVLAQASMARVVRQMPPGQTPVPVLSSPRAAVERAREILAG